MDVLRNRNKKNKSNNRISMFFVLCAGILWGCMGIMVRKMNKSGLGAMEVVSIRSFVTAILMLMYMFLFNRKELKIRVKDIWCFLGTGLLSVVFFNVCYFSCMNYTSLSTAAILLYTAPSFVMVMSFFLFKERFTVKKILAVLLAFAGCILVSGGISKEGIGTIGLLTGLGAGFGYALYSIFSRFAILKGYSSYTITTYTFSFAAIGTLPFVDYGHMLNCITGDVTLIPFGIVMTFITTVAAYLLYTKGLAGIENGKASILASVEPVVASVVGVALFGEVMTPAGGAGMLLVLASCFIIR